MKNNIYSLILAIFFLLSLEAKSGEISVQGKGEVPTSGSDATSLNAKSRQQAVVMAVKVAVDRTLGANASDRQDVRDKIEILAGQLDSYKLDESAKSEVVGDNFIQSISLKLDDMKFRKTLSDLGIAVNTSEVRAFAVLMIMDEFFTKPRDVKMPISELVEYKREKGAEHKESLDYSDKQDEKKDIKAAAQVDAKSSVAFEGSDKLSAKEVSYKGSVSGNASASNSEKASFEDKSVKSSDTKMKHDLGAKSHDNTYYKKLVQYQPQNVPAEKDNYTLAAMQAQFQELDVRILDNAMFRSKHFKGKNISIDKLQSTEELSKYVKFAKSEAKADFFNIGTSVIIDNGKNTTTNAFACDGLVTVRTFSTVDGESVASESFSDSSSGDSPDQCRTNVARKIANTAGLVLATRYQDYFKRRLMYGKEMVITYIGNLPMIGKAQLFKAIKSLNGVENMKQRRADDQGVEYTVTYKSGDPIEQSIAMALANVSTFSNLDAKVDGNLVKLCPNSCKGK